MVKTKRWLIAGVLLAVLAAVAASLFAGRASATTHVLAQRSCHMGGANHQNHTGPPGSETVWLAHPDSPSQCEQYSAKAVNSAGTWYSGWVSLPGSDATTTHNVPAQGLIKAWIRRQRPGNGDRQCERVYPTQGTWYSCPATFIHTTALARRTCPPGSGPWYIRTFNLPQTRPSFPYAGFDRDITGDTIKARRLSDPNGHGARLFNWDKIGCTHYGDPVGYMKTDAGKILSAETNPKGTCTAGRTNFVLKARVSNRGTLLAAISYQNRLYFAPRACNQSIWRSGGDWRVLASDNFSGHRYVLQKLFESEPGWYKEMVLLGVSAHATAQAAHGVTARRCTESENLHTGVSVATFTWTNDGNNCNLWGRAFVQCKNATGSRIIYNGRFVQTVGVKSDAGCTTSHPDLIGDGYDWRTCLSCLNHHVWVHGPNVRAARL